MKMKIDSPKCENVIACECIYLKKWKTQKTHSCWVIYKYNWTFSSGLKCEYCL